MTLREIHSLIGATGVCPHLEVRFDRDNRIHNITVTFGVLKSSFYVTEKTAAASLEYFNSMKRQELNRAMPDNFIRRCQEEATMVSGDIETIDIRVMADWFEDRGDVESSSQLRWLADKADEGKKYVSWATPSNDVLADLEISRQRILAGLV